MSASKNMTVSVGGIDITIQTDEDRGYIQKLAAKVDEKVGSYLRMGAKVTVAQAAVLTAMELCDEFEKNNAAVENMRAQMRSYIDDSIRAAADRDRYKAELDRTRNELSKLNNKLYERNGNQDSLY